ncbi:MAG: sigma-54-dependent Fis family transcriptional regulator [Burkholderiales bacterium]|nr:sigma-54-dependent Fis family transcriptional regulator [Burkholderiales bacterium]
MIRNPLMDRELARGGLELGRIYAEAVEGTSGIGTCIVESKPVVVHRTDHFLAVHKDVTCTAVPIDDPQGRLLAVLDVSALSSHEDKRSQLLALQLTRIAAEAVENKLILSQRSKDQFLVTLHECGGPASGMSDAFFLMHEGGRIASPTKAAIRLVPRLAQRAGPLFFEECFGESPQRLLDVGVHRLSAGIVLRPSGSVRMLIARIDGALQAPDKPAAGPSSLPRRELVANTNTDGPTLGGDGLRELAGEDESCRRLVSLVARVMKNDLPVLVLGETGSGKEMFVRAFHRASERRNGPFVAVNCAALPESLIESELFGYRDGAFTGSKKGGSRGRILEAHGGTLFLDEIGDMPLSMQARLLRVIAQREVTPLGASTAIPVDFRLLCATHQNLERLAAAKLFREDLYYRINGAVFELPAFRQRTDRSFLVRRLIEDAVRGRAAKPRYDDRLVESLAGLPWPGNIRQLSNAIRFAVSVADDTLTLDDFPADVRRQGAPVPVAQFMRGTATDAVPFRAPADVSTNVPPALSAGSVELLAALQRNRWNIMACARELGISRSTIYRRMNRFGIVEPNKQIC